MAYASGVRGTGINFDGVDDFLCADTNDDDTCDDDSDLDVTGNFTTGAWVNASTWGVSSSVRGIIGKSRGGPNDPVYAIYFDSTNLIGTFYNGSAYQSVTYATSNLNTGTWYYIVFVHDKCLR